MNSSMISSDTLIKTLSRKIDEVLSPLIPKGTACALIDFPNYSNPGDSAIWLGERAWLKKNNSHVVYMCDKVTYSKNALAERIDGGIILLQGGGNFGDLWEDLQLFRERVIQDFPDHRIIQLPQSIYYKNADNLKRTRGLLTKHKDFILLCRDTRTFDLVQKEFGVSCALCPDMAFALGPIEQPALPTTNILWLSRTDKETLNSPAPYSGYGIVRTDWLEEDQTTLMDQIGRISQEILLDPAKERELYPELSALFDPVAKERLLRGCQILNSGMVVVTDRLHGHIMSLLMGIPHIVLDNSYGKVEGFYETWTKDSDLTRWADSPEEVVELLTTDHLLRRLIQQRAGKLAMFDALLNELQDSLRTKNGWATSEELVKKAWLDQVNRAKQEILALASTEQPFILADEDQLRSELNLPRNRVVPFPELENEYAGPPADDASAILALERWLDTEANLLVITWPAFWYLDYYSEFAHYLRKNFACVFDNTRMVAFDLHSRIDRIV